MQAEYFSNLSLASPFENKKTIFKTVGLTASKNQTDTGEKNGSSKEEYAS
jgi:hypothetical protein